MQKGGCLWARAEREPPWPGRVCRGASPGGGQEGAEAGEARTEPRACAGRMPSETRVEIGLLGPAHAGPGA